METEIWKDLNIKGYEKYQVSNLGRVRSLKGKAGTPRLLKPAYNKQTKAVQVSLYSNVWKKGQVESLPRLVAKAFLGLPDTLEKVVIHLDHDPCNNKVDNLAVVNQTDALQHTRKKTSENAVKEYLVQIHDLSLLSADSVDLLKLIRQIQHSRSLIPDHKIELIKILLDTVSIDSISKVS